MRITQLDPDYRRSPKTDNYCVRCQKDIKLGAKVRWIHLINGGWDILHPEDEDLYDRFANAASDLGLYQVGMDCAKKIGMEFTSE